MRFSNLSGVIAPIVILLLFGSVLVGDTRLAFRDVSHFYTPLYDYVAQRTSGFQIPLWNPLDHNGIPMIGESTTAVLYPLRTLIYSVADSFGMPETSSIGWYVVVHLIIACAGATWLAKRSGASGFAAQTAGAIYSLSGGVFFLHTNPPFLVGVAWLPFAIAAFTSRCSLRPMNRILLGSFALTMMVLGGDPQCAYHTMLVAGAIVLCRAFRRTKQTRQGPSATRSTLISIAACMLTMLMAMPQIWSSLQWSEHSQRIQKSDTAISFAPPVVGTQRHQAYQFSLPPWHLTEIATPNAWGHLYPANHRFSQVIPGDGRMWTPTIYCGMIGLIALVARLGMWRKSGLDIWSTMAISTLFLSMGHFGFAWLLQQAGVLPTTDSAVGGPYWFLHEFAPGYSAFRYPTKWLPFFSLSIAILAALWTDHSCLPESEGSIRFASVKNVTPYVLFSLVLLFVWIGLVAIGNANQWHDLPSISDEYWGPLSIHDGIQEACWSLMHSTIVFLLLLLIIKFHWSPFKTMESSKAFFVLLIVVVDLAFAVAPTVLKVDRKGEKDLLPRNANIDGVFQTRVTAGNQWPESWRRKHSDRRVLEMSVGERSTDFGRWHLTDNRHTFNSMVSIQSRHHTVFWKAASNKTKSLSAENRPAFWKRVWIWLGVDELVSVDGERRIEGLILPAVVRKASEERGLKTNIHSQWSVWESEGTLEDQMVEVLDRLNSVQPDGESTHIEDHPNPGPKIQLQTPSLSPGWIIDIAVSETHRVENDTTPRLLSRPVFQDGNWFALAKNENGNELNLDVHQVDILQQGVIVPQGAWTIEFRYAPRWFATSVVICIAGWFAWLALALNSVYARFRKLRKPSH